MLNGYTWLVTLQRFHTVEDMKSRAVGRKTLKSVIVECNRDSVGEKVVKGDYKIAKIEDWDLLITRQHMENIKYLFRM